MSGDKTRERPPAPLSYRYRPRCELCPGWAYVEADGSYYCRDHGGFAQIAHRHGLVSIKAVSR